MTEPARIGNRYCSACSVGFYPFTPRCSPVVAAHRPFYVMAVLVTAIYVFLETEALKTWMAGIRRP